LIRWPLRGFLVHTALHLAHAAGAESLVFLSLDDSLTVKGQATRHLEGVDWHHDHTASRPGHHVYKNGMVFLLLRLHVGPFSFTVDMRLYLREKTVRRLNRGRAKAQRLKFRSKISLARTMLAEIAPLIPNDYPIYVLFDSWYAAAKLIQWCRRRHWHVICCGGSYIKGSDVHEVGEVDVGVVAMTTLSRWIPSLRAWSPLNRIQ
jgi:hypothetical protein